MLSRSRSDRFHDDERGGCRRRRGRFGVITLAAVSLLALAVLTILRAPSPPAEEVETRATAADAVLESLQQRYGQQQGSDPEALLSDTRAAVASDPDHVPLRNFLALLLSEVGHAEEAYDTMVSSLARDGFQAEIHFGAGVLATQLERVDAAGRHYQTAVEQDPQQAAYRVHLAMIRIKQRRHAEAEQLLLQAVQLDSNLADAYYGLAELYFVQNKLMLALQQIEKAVERMPLTQRDKQVKFLRKKAWILRRDNRWSDALATLKRLTPRERREPEVLEEVAVCLGQLGRTADAAAAYEAAWVRAPLDVALVTGAARWRLAHGDLDLARQHLATLRMLQPTAAAVAELASELEP